MAPHLFHVSDDPGITLFEPRTHATWPDMGPRVWAIEERLLQNYLLPRDCPRVTFYAIETSTEEDIETYLGGDRSRHIVRVEDAWQEQINAAALTVYHLPEKPFISFDTGAGYWVSEEPVRPVSLSPATDLPAAMILRSIDFAGIAKLWPLFDAVAASSLQFSMIRMRFAQGR